MNAFQYFFALDLELNNSDNGTTPNPPIIQVGIAIGTWDHYAENQISKYKWYLDPGEPILPFITNLTGITDEDIRTKSVPWDQMAFELSTIIRNLQPFTNPITWGGGDSTELLTEFKKRNIDFPHFGHRWIDVKTWYVLHRLAKSQSAKGGLRSAMSYYNMHFEGEPHRADDDALNTLRLFFNIMDQQSKVNTVIKMAKEL
jgi:inhibitor of KinA sporulation pathway (predicted exonuclease)